LITTIFIFENSPGCQSENREGYREFIHAGKPTQNSLVEQFNRTFRRDGIDSYMFDSLPDIIRYADAWAWMYNNERPILPGGN